jgi:hypothetical protein
MKRDHMQIMLGQILVAQLQKHGIHAEDYQRVAKPTYDALDEIEKDLHEGTLIQFPNGTTLKVIMKVGDADAFGDAVCGI